MSDSASTGTQRHTVELRAGAGRVGRRALPLLAAVLALALVAVAPAGARPGGPRAGQKQATCARAAALASRHHALAPGTSTRFCSLPRHEAAGMKATLTFAR
jgi:hypothetical protein